MGIGQCESEGMGILIVFPHTSNTQRHRWMQGSAEVAELLNL